MGRSFMPASGLGGCRRIRGLGLAVLTILGVMALPAAAAQADSTWAGNSAATPASPNWSDGSNWVGGTAPTPATAGNLTFPTLTTCTSCYSTTNDLSGVNANSLTFSNTTGRYSVRGASIAVGAGGITDDPGGSTGTVINAPLTLSAGQTWTIALAGFYNNLSLLGGATGAQPLSVAFPATAHGDLFVNSDMEVGNVTVSGVGGLHLGSSTIPGSVNGTDGNSVTVSTATVVANAGARVGALTMSSGTLLLGTGASNNQASTLQVKGGTTLGSTATTKMLITDNGSTAGTDFSQLSATGTVTLGGTLSVSQGPGSGGCAALLNGDAATLVTTTGSLAPGTTFANAPEGATLPMSTNGCPGPAPSVVIHYTTNSVTATVVGGTTPPPPKSTGKLLGPGGRLTVIGGKIRFAQKCQSKVLCRGTFSFTATVRGKNKKVATVRCASGSFRIKANRSATIRVRLSKACLRLLRAQRHHRLTVIYASKSSTGQVGQRKRIMLVLR